MNANPFVTNHQINAYNAMQLVKLHGSVNWIKNQKRDAEVKSSDSRWSFIVTFVWYSPISLMRNLIRIAYWILFCSANQIMIILIILSVCLEKYTAGS
jgi:hypothetical protein